MTRRVAILVTGSRDWSDREAIRSTLLPWKHACQRSGDVVLIHGDCGKRGDGSIVSGADLLAEEKAAWWGWDILPMPAVWRRGNQDGPDRNQRMVHVLTALYKSDYECHVFAFPLPQSKGTWDCIRKAQRGGFRVGIYNEEPER